MNLKVNYFSSENCDVIKPISQDDYWMGSVHHCFQLLLKCWCKETCAPRMADNYSEDNPTLGQCSITSFLIQDIYGGEVYGIDLKDGSYHCYNKIGNIIFDLTSHQFKEPLNYLLENPQSRQQHFSSEEKYQRYLLLKNKLEALKND